MGILLLHLLPSWRTRIRHLLCAKTVLHAWEIAGQARNDGLSISVTSPFQLFLIFPILFNEFLLQTRLSLGEILAKQLPTRVKHLLYGDVDVDG